MKDFVILKFTGDSVRLLCELNPAHRAFVVLENGIEVLYVRLLKALYGCVQSALLWYEIFSNTLQDMGFTLNPYDQCVANCDIEGSQCTICWYELVWWCCIGLVDGNAARPLPFQIDNEQSNGPVVGN